VKLERKEREKGEKRKKGPRVWARKSRNDERGVKAAKSGQARKEGMSTQRGGALQTMGFDRENHKGEKQSVDKQGPKANRRKKKKGTWETARDEENKKGLGDSEETPG